jgi:hypothetical protein
MWLMGTPGSLIFIGRRDGRWGGQTAVVIGFNKQEAGRR